MSLGLIPTATISPFATASPSPIPLDVVKHSAPAWHGVVGVALAMSSGFFVGASTILKKRGMLDAQQIAKRAGTLDEKGNAPTVEYLRHPMWWLGIAFMALGEGSNVAAYAFVPAVLVTPLGALSVVVSAILAAIFLKERLSFSGKVGCAQCLIGATIIVLHGPTSSKVEKLSDFLEYVMAPSFLAYSFVCVFAVLYMIYNIAPRYGDKNPMVYIGICSIIGSFLVIAIEGFGASLTYTFENVQTNNQFVKWQMYPLLAFVVFAVLSQIHFESKALNLFSTAVVSPMYYVSFTTTTMISSSVLFRGFPVESVRSGITVLLGFTVIVGGVSLLFQYSVKVQRLVALHKARAAARKQPKDIDDAEENDPAWFAAASYGQPSKRPLIVAASPEHGSPVAPSANHPDGAGDGASPSTPAASPFVIEDDTDCWWATPGGGYIPPHDAGGFGFGYDGAGPPHVRRTDGWTRMGQVEVGGIAVSDGAGIGGLDGGEDLVVSPMHDARSSGKDGAARKEAPSLWKTFRRMRRPQSGATNKQLGAGPSRPGTGKAGGGRYAFGNDAESEEESLGTLDSTVPSQNFSQSLLNLAEEGSKTNLMAAAGPTPRVMGAGLNRGAAQASNGTSGGAEHTAVLASSTSGPTPSSGTIAARPIGNASIVVDITSPAGVEITLPNTAESSRPNTAGLSPPLHASSRPGTAATKSRSRPGSALPGHSGPGSPLTAPTPSRPGSSRRPQTDAALPVVNGIVMSPPTTSSNAPRYNLKPALRPKSARGGGEAATNAELRWSVGTGSERPSSGTMAGWMGDAGDGGGPGPRVESAWKMRPQSGGPRAVGWGPMSTTSYSPETSLGNEDEAVVDEEELVPAAAAHKVRSTGKLSKTKGEGAKNRETGSAMRRERSASDQKDGGTGRKGPRAASKTGDGKRDNNPDNTAKATGRKSRNPSNQPEGTKFPPSRSTDFNDYPYYDQLLKDEYGEDDPLANLEEEMIQSYYGASPSEDGEKAPSVPRRRPPDTDPAPPPSTGRRPRRAGSDDGDRGGRSRGGSKTRGGGGTSAKPSSRQTSKIREKDSQQPWIRAGGDERGLDEEEEAEDLESHRETRGRRREKSRPGSSISFRNAPDGSYQPSFGDDPTGLSSKRRPVVRDDGNGKRVEGEREPRSRSRPDKNAKYRRRGERMGVKDVDDDESF
ncbi:hypothetical protein HDU96_001783 [Phlyctochytrium bullatum]|nr:hypothetical protein HDU96_001783 [Phlyctochytrium bullatum]